MDPIHGQLYNIHICSSTVWAAQDWQLHAAIVGAAVGIDGLVGPSRIINKAYYMVLKPDNKIRFFRQTSVKEVL